MVVEARRNGLYIGNREDSTFQLNGEPNVDLETWFLDNCYTDPDLDRYLERYHEEEPAIGVLGDAYTKQQAAELNEAAQEILDDHPHRTIIVGVKNRDVVDVLDDDIVLGVPNGSSDITVEDLGYDIFRGRDVHVLGGAPRKQYNAIDKLTCNTLGDHNPANVVSVDWNGYLGPMLQYGEYWTRDGYEQGYGMSLREMMDETAREIRAFWEERELFPETTPEDLAGPAVKRPDYPVYANSGDALRTHRDFETAFIGEYEEGTYAFDSETAKKWVEHRDSLTPL